MSYFAHSVEANLDQIIYPEKYRYLVVRVPAASLPADAPAKVRISGELNDHPVDGALVSDGEGGRYLHVANRLAKTIGVGLGDPVALRFNIVADDVVVLPDALEAALWAHDGAREKFDALTPGKRRGLAHRVASAKQAATQARRAEAIVAELMAGGQG
ncbi:MAG: YdeI/OmpD-associated family protein [Pseudomonadota bacterium]